MAEKRYFWLKLPEDFFQSKEIKRLRKIAGGDTYTVIYLKLLLKSLETGGKLYFEGIEDSFADEIALDIDEDPDNVEVTMRYLLSKGLMTMNNNEAFMEKVPVMVGSESSAAERMRRMRSTRNNVTDKRNNVTPLLRSGYTDIEIDKDIDKDTEIDKEKDKDKESEKESVEKKPKRKRFVPPTLEEVQAYINEKGYRIDAERFVTYYQANGWMVGRNHMKDWKATVRNWNARDQSNGWNNNRQQTPEQREQKVFDDIDAWAERMEGNL